MRNKTLVAALSAFAALLAACQDQDHASAMRITGGDPDRGSAAIFRYGCGSCHTIAGITNARGLVGPPLSTLRDRIYVAGMLPNTTTNLTHWIEDPKSVNAKTAMPKLGVTDRDAVDIAAYLYSIP